MTADPGAMGEGRQWAVVSLPLTPTDWGQLLMSRTMTEEEWDRMMSILNAMWRRSRPIPRPSRRVVPRPRVTRGQGSAATSGRRPGG